MAGEEIPARGKRKRRKRKRKRNKFGTHPMALVALACRAGQEGVNWIKRRHKAATIEEEAGYWAWS